MAETLFGGKPAHTTGELPAIGSDAPTYTLVAPDLSSFSSDEFAGQRVLLNIFPSVDTGVCSASVRRFNAEAAGLADTVVVCVSRDTPMAQARFCGAEGIDAVRMGSDFRGGAFGRDYGVDLIDSGFAGLLARAVVIVEGDGTVGYVELVPSIGDEPDYAAALAALR
jgi:thiol peroxidase